MNQTDYKVVKNYSLKWEIVKDKHFLVHHPTSIVYGKIIENDGMFSAFGHGYPLYWINNFYDLEMAKIAVTARAEMLIDED